MDQIAWCRAFTTVAAIIAAPSILLAFMALHHQRLVTIERLEMEKEAAIRRERQEKKRAMFKRNTARTQLENIHEAIRAAREDS